MSSFFPLFPPRSQLFHRSYSNKHTYLRNQRNSCRPQSHSHKSSTEDQDEEQRRDRKIQSPHLRSGIPPETGPLIQDVTLIRTVFRVAELCFGERPLRPLRRTQSPLHLKACIYTTKPPKGHLYILSLVSNQIPGSDRSTCASRLLT